ncbi:MAG: ParB-like protein partition protein [candidate division WWE3 bacterium GW2011_GWB1_47_11]|uniref:ParB-like protein partition protein n=1 Tax=candidate division WWE3 bacterium GW2011_GWB1_47_11 TaxID=1619117 RepID=A0A0G1RGI3_UNCKA|nr:MAG: ParB-like protein partition protein [candidate division WWE3 bacterium GW2011_GWB1_47_11]
MSEFFNNAIFWIEVDKIKPNPFQPRKEFDELKLADLARSIRQYGVLQPLTVSRREVEKADGGLAAEYELIAGERRLRAAKIAGIAQVPVLIRAGFDDDKTKLELAIIENLQREDLNPLDRAQAFEKLVKEFGFKHTEIASKIGKSREYVSNSLRILALPEEMRQALAEGKINEGHTRPLLMLIDRPAEQVTLFKEIMLKRLTVRDTESIARRIATDRVRKKEYLYAPEILQMERDLTEVLGTRVAIEPKENGGKVSIDFMTESDLRELLNSLVAKATSIKQENASNTVLQKVLGSPEARLGERASGQTILQDSAPSAGSGISVEDLDDRSEEEKTIDENTFDPKNFSI